MAITKFQGVKVPYFCEECGKETFEGYVYGRYVNRQITASSPDRTMYCDDCRPAPRLPKIQLSSAFYAPLVWDENE